MVVVPVRTCEGPDYLELSVEEVVAVAAISDPVVDNQLLEHFNCRVAVERQVFTVAIDDFSVLLEALFDSQTGRALVREEALGTSVFDVVATHDAKLLAPSEWLLDLLCAFLEILYRLTDSLGTLVRPQVGLALPLEDVAIKGVKHLLEMRDEGLGIGAHRVKQVEQVLVHLGGHGRAVCHS